MAADNRSVPAVRVLLVEDFEAFRAAVRSILGKHGGLQILGEACDGLDAVRRAQELNPDLILLDIGLPELNGIEAARQILTVSRQSKIVFVTQESNPEIVQEAIHLGASGYVVKTRVAKDLLAAIDAVLDGKQFVSGGLPGPELTTQGADRADQP
jgi:DNA-binding NarL/FixJ family response regulator